MPVVSVVILQRCNQCRYWVSPCIGVAWPVVARARFPARSLTLIIDHGNADSIDQYLH